MNGILCRIYSYKQIRNKPIPTDPAICYKINTMMTEVKYEQVGQMVDGSLLFDNNFVDHLFDTPFGMHTGERPLIEIGCTPATPPSGTGCIYFVKDLERNLL